MVRRVTCIRDTLKKKIGRTLRRCKTTQGPFRGRERGIKSEYCQMTCREGSIESPGSLSWTDFDLSRVKRFRTRGNEIHRDGRWVKG